MAHPTRAALAALILVSAVFLAPARAEMEKVDQAYYSMTILPDQDAPPWMQMGGGAALLLSEGRLLLNDNRADDRIGYQTLVGRIEASHRVRLSARVQVYSNFDGRGVIMEISRPGLQVALHLFTDRVDMVERDENGRWRWLATVTADMTSMRDIALEKSSSEEPGGEVVRLLLDDVVRAQAAPHGGSLLEVGRVVVGSLSGPSFGASVWDWIQYDLDGLRAALPAEEPSVGALKARYR